jgi:hypothetical protein
MKTWHPRRLLRSHDSSPAVRKSDLRLGTFASSILVSTESAPSNDLNCLREFHALKLSTVAKATDFSLQARKDFAKIWTKVEAIGVNDFDTIRNPQQLL